MYIWSYVWKRIFSVSHNNNKVRHFFEKYPAGAFVFYTSEDMSSTSSFGCWETLYFYIQANSVNIKTSSWFFCWSCKNFLSYNLIYIYLRMLLLRRNGQKDPLKFLSHFFCLFFLSSYTISSFFLLWRHFHMIRWLQTITRMENEWNEHNRRKKNEENKKKKKLTFTSHTKMQVPLCTGFTTVIKFYHSFYDTLCHFFLSDTCFYCALSKPFFEDVLS